MATATQLITKAFRKFDEETNSKYEQDGNRSTALDYLNEGYFDVCRETHCSQTSSSLTTTSGTREYSLPSDFVAMWEVEYPEGYCFLVPMFYKDININQLGGPSRWYLTPTKIGFEFTPNGAYTYTLTYYNGPTNEIALDDTPSLIPTAWQNHILPYYVLWRLFATDKREEIVSRAPFWQGEYEKRLATMRDYFSGDGRYGGRLQSLE